MQTVLMITTDPRIVGIKTAIQPLLSAKICIVPDFEAGLAAIFTKMPHLVFIQQEMDGVKATRLIRHVRALLQEQAPKFVHLMAFPDAELELDADVNRLELSTSFDLLVSLFTAEIGRIPEIVWKNTVFPAHEKSGGQRHGESAAGASPAPRRAPPDSSVTVGVRSGESGARPVSLPPEDKDFSLPYVPPSRVKGISVPLGVTLPSSGRMEGMMHGAPAGTPIVPVESPLQHRSQIHDSALSLSREDMSPRNRWRGPLRTQASQAPGVMSVSRRHQAFHLLFIGLVVVLIMLLCGEYLHVKQMDREGGALRKSHHLLYVNRLFG